MEDSRFKWSEETKETDFQLFTSNQNIPSKWIMLSNKRYQYLIWKPCIVLFANERTRAWQYISMYLPGSCWEFKVYPRTSLNNPLISNIFKRYGAQKFPFEIYVLTFNETYDMYTSFSSCEQPILWNTNFCLFTFWVFLPGKIFEYQQLYWHFLMYFNLNSKLLPGKVCSKNT